MTVCDGFARPIQYLRVSVTDRCNLRCVYCMPEEGIPTIAHGDILRFEEIALVVRAAAGLGISKVRLTGGEPLVRRGIVELVRMLAEIPGVDDLSMTTNGILLASFAPALAEAGLRRVNVSLDTLDPERFRRITRRGELADVLAGIEAARRAGLEPVKINMVVIRGLNDDEVVEMARRTLTEGWHVRFIEVMPLGSNEHWAADGFVSAEEIRARVEKVFGELEAELDAPVPGGGPARYYRVPGASGTIGFITPVSEHFCARCNRLRLTADGQLRPCLLSDAEIDLRAVLRAGGGVEDVQAVLQHAIMSKPLRHHLADGVSPHDREMAQIGG